MKRNYRIIIALIVVLYCTLISLNQCFSQQKDERQLSLEGFIRVATEKDTVFQEILINELTLKYKKALVLPPADIVLSVKSQYEFLFDPDDSDFRNVISLEKLFPDTGTTIAAEYDSVMASDSRDVFSEFTASISQPVAENAFGRNTRMLDRITGLEIEVSHFQIVEAYEDYLAKLIQTYYDWYSAYENMKTAENSYKENLRLLENIKEREKHKIALPVDVNKVSLQVVAKKESLIILQNDYTKYLNKVKEALRCDENEEIIPVESSLYSDIAINFAEDYKLFNDSSRTSLILKLLEEKSSVEVDKFADELLPSIDLVAGFSLEGRGHTLDDSDKRVFAGVSLDWPIPGEVERAKYETSKIDLMKTELSSENIHIRLYTDLKNLNDQIKKERALINVADEKISLARKILEDDKENYSLGRLTLNDLIDEVNILESNKFNKIHHTIQLRRLIVEWLRLSDKLVTKIPAGNLEKLEEAVEKGKE